MAFFSTDKVETARIDLIERLTDLSGRLKGLEDRFDAKLDDLSARYRRAEQSERRLEEKRDSSECDDPDDDSDLHPALVALKRRQHGVPASNALNSRFR